MASTVVVQVPIRASEKKYSEKLVCRKHNRKDLVMMDTPMLIIWVMIQNKIYSNDTMIRCAVNQLSDCNTCINNSTQERIPTNEKYNKTAKGREGHTKCSLKSGLILSRADRILSPRNQNHAAAKQIVRSSIPDGADRIFAQSWPRRRKRPGDVSSSKQVL